LKILVVNPSLAERIRDHLPEDIEIVKPETGTDDELAGLAGDVEVIVATRLSPEVARVAFRLKLLQKTGAGVDDMPFDALREETWMANTSGSNPVPLAEGAVALVFALAKKVIQRHGSFMEGRGVGRGVMLSGKKAGIVGFGSIGREVGRMLQCMGMRVLAVKRSSDDELVEAMGLEFLGTPNDLIPVMSESDFVVVTAPLTPETRGMIGEEELRAMKPSAYIVNVARAALIQEEPLYRALNEGWIAGAAIDVWWTPHFWDPLWNEEGKPASLYPFWELPNVICTPHSIVSTDGRSDAGLKIMVENILRVRRGEPPINQVDKKLRY
jgi:phosphoglycerate dehydrogenase-like enzyme